MMPRGGAGVRPVRHFVADDAGALLVRSGLVTASALESARARQTAEGGTIGEQLVYGKAISDEALTEFYRSRLLVPQVNPNQLAKLAANVVQTIPADMAVELRAVPVQLDNDTNLTVAMGDPSDSHAVDEIAFFTGTYVVRAIATQMQIAWCLAHYYGHVTPLGQRLLQPKPGQLVTPVSPRPKGLTSRINASRHRGLAPVTGPVDVPRPNADLLDPAKQAIPEVPSQRARTASGEIRVPLPRAQSVKPPMPEESGPVITIEVADDATGPLPPPKRRVVRTDPPELAARAGELRVDTKPVRKVDLEEPRIVISMEDERAPTDEDADADDDADADTGSVLIHAAPPKDVEMIDSAPILLDRKRPSDPPVTISLPPHAPTLVPLNNDEPEEVVELSRPKTSGRIPRLTQIGVGAIPAVTARSSRDTDAVPSAIDDAATDAVPELVANEQPLESSGAAWRRGEIDDTRLDTPYAPARDDDSTGDRTPAPPPSPADDTNPNVLAAPPAPSPHRRTIVDTTVPPPKPHKPARPIEHDDLDDGWGPPGTTIPPPLLGAMPGTEEDRRPSGVIPIPSEDSAPLMMAVPANAPEVEMSGEILLRTLEDTTARTVELIRALERTLTRDEVVRMMIDFLAETHRRAGFLSMKGGELTVFAMVPAPALMPQSALRLDRPSTFQDVVGTRLPYRGPIGDDASRQFLSSALGVAPAELLLVPVAVRERVVGVLFALDRKRHTFDDQLGLAARAAGMALERILRNRQR